MFAFLQGCGIVRFTSASAAATAKSLLHGKYKWTEEAPPMVVEWVNEDKMRSTCCKAGATVLFVVCPSTQGSAI
jgi:hypothetical protein